MKTLLKSYKLAREQGANAIEIIKEVTTKGQAYEGQHFLLIALMQSFQSRCSEQAALMAFVPAVFLLLACSLTCIHLVGL